MAFGEVVTTTEIVARDLIAQKRLNVSKAEPEGAMSTVHGTGLVTMTARKHFLNRGRSIRRGDRVILPVADARQLKQERCLQHVLVKLPPSFYEREPMEVVFE